MFESLEKLLIAQGLPAVVVELAVLGAAVLLVILTALLVGWFANRFLVPSLEKALRPSSNQWDDTLSAHGFFRRLGAVLPLITVLVGINLLFSGQDPAGDFIRRLLLALFVLLGVRIITSFLGAALQIYDSYDISKERSIRGYVEVFKIILWVMAAISAVAFIADKSPWGIMSVLGGLTAVLLLIFKDTILGFVASLQISGNNMARVGDWIEMPQYGADGDVIDVSIHTVKVQNWDKTITTIPTYALVSNSFKNWRGMSESGGRRIKRAIYIDMNSIRFCDDELLARFAKYGLLKDYLAAKQNELDAYNKERQTGPADMVNGRRQTNIGVFRAYIIAYLRANPKVHQGMTFLVRHLAPTPQGLPVEIYVFSSDQVWANYEAIQADIFDHLLAVVPEFGLRVFQYPTGSDLAGLMARP
jgi:miniconductance mechanosensitive channel